MLKNHPMPKDSTKLRSELRLRVAHPLSGSDGQCEVIYDLERTFVIEVPPELRYRVAVAYNSGTFDDECEKWFQSEDLLTTAPYRAFVEGQNRRLPPISDVSLDLAGSCNLGCGYCFEKDINSRIGRMSETTALAALEFAFQKSRDSKRISLHFGSGEPLIRFDMLQRIVSEALQRASMMGQEVTFELTTNATLVTEEVASFLQDHPFNVRVSCDGPPPLHNALRPFIGGKDSYSSVERGLLILLRYMPDRTTVNSVLSHESRLIDLWRWAKSLKIRHYHVIKVGAYLPSPMNLNESELSVFVEDLKTICDELSSDLAESRVPIDYQPITKMVRRLMIPAPITRFCGVANSYLGIASNGQIFPCFRHLGLDEYKLGDVERGIDDGRRHQFLDSVASEVDRRPICNSCWARYLCGGGCYADSTVYGPDKLKPQVQHCPFWRAEIEQAIRFYIRLLNTDPRYCMRLFGDEYTETSSSPKFLARPNCS